MLDGELDRGRCVGCPPPPGCSIRLQCRFTVKKKKKPGCCKEGGLDVNHSVVMQGVAGSESDEHGLELSHNMTQRVTRLCFRAFQSSS